MIHRLKVSCLPKDIPQRIELNISELDINHSIHVKELNVPNVTILENLDNPVVSIVPPTVVKEPEPAVVAEEAPKEPEVVGKGKKVEEGEEGAAPAAPAKTEAKPAGKEAKEEKKK